jgi:cytochrome c oxidase assembly protein subunit 15
LPAVLAPSPLVLALLLACLLGGGYVLGRTSSLSWAGGASAGSLSALLNLLVLGSLVSGNDPGRVAPAALWWIPGSFAASALLGCAGAALGARRSDGTQSGSSWLHRFAWVAVGATALLLAAGGLVTSAEAGLAVHDWPTSFGYNMFLYPFARMTGGIYYEHAHRLLGALVGLTTVVLAVFVQVSEKRRWVRVLAWATVPAVVVQGILGGIRVTERDLALAMAHGILAQLFFTTFVVLAVVTSPRWLSAGAPVKTASSTRLRVLGLALVAAAVGQLVLGASQRHFSALLLAHVFNGLAVVLPLALSLGLRVFALGERQPWLSRLGLGLVIAVSVQVLLGFGALVVTLAGDAGSRPASANLVIATAHQWFGALLLATAVVLVCWTFRGLRSDPRPFSGPRVREGRPSGGPGSLSAV